jgi:Holliday junction resolvasome RuvABC ATP-dependent DNA helicase subunit
MDFSSLWCEKYRPKTIEDLCISDEIRELLESFKQKRDIPHLLFTGTPGIGKTSVAKDAITYISMHLMKMVLILCVPRLLDLHKLSQ